MSLTNEQIIEAIGQKSVVEIVELIKAMEETFGVTAAAAVAAGPAVAAAAAEEQTEFTIVLAEAGDKKVNVIKAVRELTGLGLKEAKAVVDGARAWSKKAFRKKKPKLPRRHWKKLAPRSSSSKFVPCVYSPSDSRKADGWWLMPPAFFRSRLAVRQPTGAGKTRPSRRSQTEGLHDFLVIAAGAGQTSR